MKSFIELAYTRESDGSTPMGVCSRRGRDRRFYCRWRMWGDVRISQ